MFVTLAKKWQKISEQSFIQRKSELDWQEMTAYRLFNCGPPSEYRPPMDWTIYKSCQIV